MMRLFTMNTCSQGQFDKAILDIRIQLFMAETPKLSVKVVSFFS